MLWLTFEQNGLYKNQNQSSKRWVKPLKTWMTLFSLFTISNNTEPYYLLFQQKKKKNQNTVTPVTLEVILIHSMSACWHLVD